MKKILVVVAHPDDEVMGCGGTIARFAKEGEEVYTLVLGEGITARDEIRDIKKRSKDLKRLRGHIYKANNILGVKDILLHNFPDNRFDSVPLLDIVKVIEKTKRRIKPNTIFTYYQDDLNIDHRITYEAVITAARPLKFETVKDLYSFEVLSSTEWNYPLNFSPDIFFDITDTIETKLRAMIEYQTELQNFPHPRSLKGIKINAEQWGMRVGLPYVEAFKSVRCIK